MSRYEPILEAAGAVIKARENLARCEDHFHRLITAQIVATRGHRKRGTRPDINATRAAVEWLAANPGPHRLKAICEGIGVDTGVLGGATLIKLVKTGRVCKVERGVYACAPTPVAPVEEATNA